MSTSRFRPKSSKPKSSADILGSVLKYHHLEKKLEEYSAFPYWEELVGSDIAKIAVPEKIIAGKVLVVRVADAVWAQELAFRKTEFIEKLVALQTGALIQDIRFITGNPRDFAKQKPQG